MLPLQTISKYDAIKILSDARRLAILRTLMTKPATLTHLGQIFGEHPAKVRYHVKLLEQAGLVGMTHAQKVGNYTEKYYQATAAAFSIQLSILPEWGKGPTVLVSGSDDLALNLLAEMLREEEHGLAMFTLPVGSLDGLIQLRQGVCQIAGCHLLDSGSGEYNTPYVRHLFPGHTMHITTLVHRQQGLLIQSGNPLHLHGIEDLTRPDVRFINRKRGSGTRVWLDERLAQLGIASQSIRGYETIANTHLGVAGTIVSGQADAGLAVLAAAQARGLDFIPLFEERYDLVVTKEDANSGLLAPVFDAINSGAFRNAVTGLAGYQAKAAGEEIVL